MTQAQLMLKRRIKIDVRSKGMPERIRHQNREDLIEEYLKYPSRRVLFFVKRVRFMVLGHNDEGYLARELEAQPEEPEDIIAQGKHFNTLSRSTEKYFLLRKLCILSSHLVVGYHKLIFL